MRKEMKVGVVIVVVGIMISLGVFIAIGQEAPKVDDGTTNRGLGINGSDVDNSNDTSKEIQRKMDEIKKASQDNTYTPKAREWITSGPFQIDRSQYILGEKIFLVIGGIHPDEKGEVIFLRPLNDTHHKTYETVPFDGSKKNAFNYYIEPDLSKSSGICSVDDIVGTWIVIFRETNYENLEFEIIDEVLPGDEDDYLPVC